MCERILGLDPGLLRRLVACEHFLHEWIGPGAARHLDRRPIANDHLDLRLLAAVEHVGDQGRSAQARREERANPTASPAEIAVGVLADPMEAAVDREPHLASVRLLRGNEAGRIVQAVDREDMEAVRRAVATVG